MASLPNLPLTEEYIDSSTLSTDQCNYLLYRIRYPYNTIHMNIPITSIVIKHYIDKYT